MPSTHQQQPVGVSVVAIFLLIGSLFSLVWVVLLFSSPVMHELLTQRARSVPVMVFVALLNAGLSLACAIGILHGKNWARMLYIGYMPFLILISAVNAFSINMFAGILQYVISAIILLLPSSQEYFTRMHR